MQLVSLAGLGALLLAISATSASGENRVATVTSVRASVRCGPGRDYYVTDRLDRNSVVEIYGEEEGGWFAIRPPATSFSWIPAAALRRTSDEQVGEVVGNKVVAWIGSNTTPPRDHQWQVQLDSGELVEILGQADLKLVDNAGPKRCYKISPPAGEFRWIHASDIELSQGDDDSSGSSEGIRVADYQVPIGGASGEVEPAARFVTPRKPGESGSPRTAPRETGRKMTPRYTKSLGDADLDELNLELSLMVAQAPDLWDLTPLKVAAERQIELAKTPVDRARAKRLLDRIREFQSLQDRRRQLAILALDAQNSDEAARDRDPPGTSDRASRSIPGAVRSRDSGDDRGSSETSESDRLAAKPRDASSPDPAARGVDPRFDASGWLVPVHSTKRVAPPYALIDHEGNVIQYVSPAPGLNLHRYLRKKVGIYGDQNFQASLKASHVVAERVVDLERQKR